MTDDTRDNVSVDLMGSSPLPPRQIIEDLIENLRNSNTLSSKAKTRFSHSIRLLDQCLASRNEESAYADAVERAPWLTADVEQLKRHWKELRRSLHTLYKCVRRGEESRESLIYRFHAYGERFVECESDEQCLLHAAFPGPAWIDESQQFPLS